MDFKFKKNDLVKFIGESYLNLNGVTLIVEDCFLLAHLPTYRVCVKGENWRRYIFTEDKLKRVRK